MLSRGTTYLLDGYWSGVYPAKLVVMLTVVVFNSVGDALRDTLDARLRDREERFVSDVAARCWRRAAVTWSCMCLPAGYTHRTSIRVKGPPR
jgi:hypothetical protein